ncbi:hypothetical protein Nepgr_033726 [Nepenthes gracilis]|uniref:Uncharacterized protein n=1 Tax=Nepenthes gracilis TaxID=150966 RepID=A0AAD3TLY7_NEPGR|nr:hypothetical protein Nepgr_033726 [Nepenthes gracilis]
MRLRTWLVCLVAIGIRSGLMVIRVEQALWSFTLVFKFQILVFDRDSVGSVVGEQSTQVADVSPLLGQVLPCPNLAPSSVSEADVEPKSVLIEPSSVPLKGFDAAPPTASYSSVVKKVSLGDYAAQAEPSTSFNRVQCNPVANAPKNHLQHKKISNQPNRRQPSLYNVPADRSIIIQMARDHPTRNNINCSSTSADGGAPSAQSISIKGRFTRGQQLQIEQSNQQKPMG